MIPSLRGQISRGPQGVPTHSSPTRDTPVSGVDASDGATEVPHAEISTSATVHAITWGRRDPTDCVASND